MLLLVPPTSIVLLARTSKNLPSTNTDYITTMRTSASGEPSIEATKTNTKTKQPTMMSKLREIYIRLTSYPKTKTESEQEVASTTKNHFCSILKAISETNDRSELEIFDNHGIKRIARQWHNVP